MPKKISAFPKVEELLQTGIEALQNDAIAQALDYFAKGIEIDQLHPLLIITSQMLRNPKRHF